jgi:signal transduction histidine kinase
MVLLFTVLMDVEKLHINGELFSPNMIFWAIFTCICTTLVLQYFSYEKEKEQTRIAFAAKLGRQRDPEVQYQFMDVAGSISKDETIRSFIQAPEEEKRSAVEDRIDVMYLNDALSKYQSEIYLFDKQGRPLYNTDTTSLAVLQAKMSNPETDTAGMSLSFRENAQDGHLYLAKIPVKDSAGIAGYLFVDMALKRADNESAYPELLQPEISQQQDKHGYASAIYYNNHLMLQSGNWPFPVTVAQKLPPGKDQLFVENADYSALYYRIDDKSTVVVVYRHQFSREAITLFSYLFGMLMIMNLLVILYRHSLRALYRFRIRKPNLTLRMRIHYAILGVMLVSFLIIGAVTVTFLSRQYASSNENKLQDIIQVAGSEIEQYLFTHHALDTPESFNTVTRSAAFKYFITSIANRQRIDINLFAADGMLSATSRNDIYDKRLLAPIVRPDVYRQLYTMRLSSLLQHEQVERFSYLSSYISMHNSNGTILGFVNVPYFSSEKELHLQISNILVALINLYAFIFIISSFFAFLIARNITGSLNIIISQFKNINLRRNERLQWPHKDEIGRLVAEYNKMVKKVEDNAAMLVQHEREGAWREMAKQIAHEIKNPLTPMKLNIQYLQNALANGHPNVSELAAKVSASIIEQIDNLSYIASEFSNFAKMPEAKPEELELNDLLERAVQLYRNESGIAVHFYPSETALYVHADKSQLLRVCTNLLQNAVQAIDGRPEGKIEVRLTAQETQALIAFADNGKGIPEDAQDKIFKPYFTTKTSGTGLGLAMTRKIIELWKGHIWFETAAEQGTTFYITMPVVQEKVKVEPPSNQ